MVYKAVVIDITAPQLKKAIDGKSVRFTFQQLGKGGKKLYLHPENVKKVERAAMKSTGVSLTLAPGELAETYNQMVSSGSGFFGDVWKGLKKVWGVLKDTGAASQLLDMAVAPLSAATGQPALVGGIRQGIKSLTGAGYKKARYEKLKGMGLYMSNP